MYHNCSYDDLDRGEIELNEVEGHHTAVEKTDYSGLEVKVRKQTIMIIADRDLRPVQIVHNLLQSSGKRSKWLIAALTIPEAHR